ncbi:MAG: hypothetical protein IKR23_06375 [Lachnospiraceae bacterium]|nr:hypothetical protein [Lachnospiraceae bacterium]
MLGLIYIIISILAGRALLDLVYPDYRELPRKTYSGKETDLPALFVLFPFWFFSGTMVVGWLTYFAALAAGTAQPDNRHPLTIANAVVMSAAAVFIIVSEVIKRKKKTPSEHQKLSVRNGLVIAFFIVLTVFVCSMMYRSFNILQSTLRVGYSVFSDFAVHLGMIRSFSFGNNFPTQYSHFAGQDIRYHFMFEFLAGNLEYLGLPLDHAFNFPSIISFVSMSMLLFTFTVRLCGSRITGVIATLMMVFRSSPSLFRYLGSLEKGGITAGEFFERDTFFSYTPNEDWGLWNFKVYLNQRHLAFGIGVVLMALIIFTPLVYDGVKKISELFRSGRRPAKELVNDHVLMSSVRRAVFCGVLLGICAFWNGAMVIGGLCVLFVMALASSHRLEYLITAVISVVLSSLQTTVFINGDVIKPEYYYGFIAEVHTFWGSICYLLALSGALLVLAAVYFVMGRGTLKYMLLAFSAPLIFAFTVSLTPDVTVNHKYVMLSFILTGIPVAALVSALLKSSRITRFLAGVFLLVILMATGVYECRVVRNIDKYYLEFRQDSKLTQWVRENSDSKDIWLTDMLSNHEIVLGGAMLYYGWPYYAWSAGYDTYGREELVAEMFAAGSEERLKELVKQENIRFIMTDDGLRSEEHYTLREDVIAAAFPLVYQSGDICIYDAGGSL